MNEATQMTGTEQVDPSNPETRSEPEAQDRSVLGEILYGIFLGLLPFVLPFILLMLVAGPHL